MNNPEMADLLILGRLFVSEVTQGTFVPSLVNVGSELGSEVNTAVVLVEVSSLGEGFSVGTKTTGVLHDILPGLGLGLR